MEELVALVLDGAGGARRLERAEIARWTPRDGKLWVQVDPVTTEGRRWLTEESGLHEGDRSTLLRSVRQSRVDVLGDGALMLGLRVFAPDTGELRQVRALAGVDRLITVTGDPMPALEACARRLVEGHGPNTIADILIMALRVASDRDQAAALDLDQEVSDVESAAIRSLGRSFDAMRDIWQRGTALRRRLGAQREGLVQLKQKGPAWLLAPQPDLWRDMAASNHELIESVDASMDRLRGLQDYAQNRLSSVTNDRLYLLTIVSAIMMPLSFVTGLLGVNVGGIPARDTPWAFAALCAVLVLLAVGEYVLLRRLRWVPGISGAGGPKDVDRSSRRSLAQRAPRRMNPFAITGTGPRPG